MPIIPVGTNRLLGRRFAQILSISLALLALVAIVFTTVSIVTDRQDSEKMVRQDNRDMGIAVRALADAALDQSYVSVTALSREFTGWPSQTQQRPLLASQQALRQALRFDMSSEFLFVRFDNQVIAAHRSTPINPGVLEAIKQIQDPEVMGKVRLSPPIAMGLEQAVFVPMLIKTTTKNQGTVTVGALIALNSLTNIPVQLGQAKRWESEQALYLPDGRVLMHSYKNAKLGVMAPESATIAQLAKEQGQRDFQAPVRDQRVFSGFYVKSERYAYIAASMQIDEAYLTAWRQRSYLKVGLLVLCLVLFLIAERALHSMALSLSTTNTIHRRLFEDVAESVIFFSPSGAIQALNHAAVLLTGLIDTEEGLGKNIFDLIPRTAKILSDDPELTMDKMLAKALMGERVQYEFSVTVPGTGQHLDCEVSMSSFWMNKEKLMMAVFRNLTEERHHVRQQEYMANHDLLTGLPNRHYLIRSIDRQIDTYPGAQLDLILINFARFKEINETFGHRTGDTVLEVAAQRLDKSLANCGWLLARFGGTDLVAMSNANSELYVEAVCALIGEVLLEPIPVGGTQLQLHANLGLTRYPDDALDAGQLLRCADLAVAQAKAALGSWMRYDKEQDSMPGHNLKLRSELSVAIHQGQLQLAYQPKLWLENRTIAGVEALLRWEHPQRGWISPAEFIPLAESTELIHSLSRWVLGEAIDQIARWSSAGYPLKMAVNISTNNLQDPDFTGYLKDLLKRKNVPAHLLELEITEGALARNPEIVLRRLQDLRAVGIGLSLDDFGTGFSSLSYVSQFPFTSIKIDRSFVSALLGSPRDRQVAQSTISLGHNLGLVTIAEGIEDEATAAELVAMECDIGQGYLLARPMLLADFETWLANYEANATQAQRLALGRRRGYHATS